MNPPRRPAGPSWRIAAALTVLGVVGALSGCSAMGRHDAGGTLPSPMPHRSISIERGSIQSVAGCRLDTTRFQPQSPRTQVPVVLAHGFLRDQRRMEGLAVALADQGIPTVTLNFCNGRPWDGSHIQNGLDMIEVARHLGASSVIYAGFSAGGLAALVAGRLDPKTRGVLVLDLVDSGGIGVGMARALDQPLIGLAGAPAACNAHNNGRAVFATAAKPLLISIAGASHCDFESPTDWLCESVCSGVDEGSPARRRAIIDTSVTVLSDLLAQTGADRSTPIRASLRH